MNWLIWKQHRKQFLVLAIILGLYAIMAIAVGLNFRHTYHDALATCTKAGTCEQLSSDILQTNAATNLNPSLPSGGTNIIVLLILVLPFLLGMFVGVPLIAREYIEGTNLLIWTRSISRRKWLTMKLVWMLSAVIIFTSAFAALTTWWSQTGNSLYLDRFDVLKFGMQGIVPVGIAVFAVSLGVVFGAWLKRIMLAVGLTLAVVLATQIIIAGFLRPHYMTPRTGIIWTDQLSPGLSAEQAPKDALITASKIVNGHRQILDWSHPPQHCIAAQNELLRTVNEGSGKPVELPGGDGSIRSVNGGPAVKGSCLKAAGYHYEIKYQPSYRYWDFQFIETGLYLVLSLLLTGVTYRLVLRRDA